MSAFIHPRRVSHGGVSDAMNAAPLHLRPILLAVRDSGCAFGGVLQHQGEFAFAIDKTTILLLGDDLDEAFGPTAFHAKSMRRFLERCGLAVIVACEPKPELYAMAAETAILTRQHVAIVETRSEHEADWIHHLRRVKPRLPLLVGTVSPLTEARH